MNAPLSVSDLNRYVKGLLESDELLASVLVKGELSGFKSYPSGHLYFTLKDEESAVSCVMFRSSAQKLVFKPTDGLKVILAARASVYERDGKFQLYVSEMNAEGIGDLYLAFEQLKKRLSDEGLFDPSRKKRLPLLPKAVGVVTSPSGAVIRDIIQVMGRRFPNFHLKLIPAAVQGAGAAAGIADGVRLFNERGDVDVIIVGRGGGSMEDLWAFNDETLARTIAASRIPVVSAVGHETDFTICDFVADLRAPTPSAAAELVMPRRTDLESGVQDLRNRLAKGLDRRLEVSRMRLSRSLASSAFQRPLDAVERRRMRLDQVARGMAAALSKRCSSERGRHAAMAGKLDALSPLKVLARGYGLVTDPRTGRPMTSSAMVRAGDFVDVSLKDGILDCEVRSVRDR
jgi:exodeoxyribonuclease VII large subunit